MKLLVVFMHKCRISTKLQREKEDGERRDKSEAISNKEWLALDRTPLTTPP